VFSPGAVQFPAMLSTKDCREIQTILDKIDRVLDRQKEPKDHDVLNAHLRIAKMRVFIERICSKAVKREVAAKGLIKPKQKTRAD